MVLVKLISICCIRKSEKGKKSGDFFKAVPEKFPYFSYGYFCITPGHVELFFFRADALRPVFQFDLGNSIQVILLESFIYEYKGEKPEFPSGNGCGPVNDVWLSIFTQKDIGGSFKVAMGQATPMYIMDKGLQVIIKLFIQLYNDLHVVDIGSLDFLNNKSKAV